MDLLTIATVVLVISAFFSYLNVRFIKLPGTIGVVTISVTLSVIILVVGKSSNALNHTVSSLAGSINFSKVLLDVLLGFLLFASALHFDYNKLKEQKIPVLLLSTLGVLLSTAIFGTLFCLCTRLFHFQVPVIYCFVFGALISPTDPIAVSAIIKKSRIPSRLNTIISGESMFNDGVGLVLFVTLLRIAEDPGTSFTFRQVGRLFFREVAGGIGLGLLAGYIAYRMIRAIRDYQTIFLISLALVVSISLIAGNLDVSIPLAAVTAGLVVGNRNLDKEGKTMEFLKRIWQLIDDVLNTILFVLIGLQLVVMPALHTYWLPGIFSILALLMARLASVSLPAIFLLRKPNMKNLFILTWAGLRGGISIAMALSLPASPFREIILAACYFIVIFSIIFQGLTLGKLVTRLTD